jgi:putative addiction module component (TIGR02574 family)
MNKTNDDMIRDALSLPPEARVQLAETLLDSVTPADHVAIEAAWGEEAERRLREYEAGKVQAIPASEVFRDLLAGIKHK